MAISADQSLTKLINVGPDAFSNMYLVTFNLGKNTPEDDDSFSVRAETFNIPEVEISTVDLPFQNSSYSLAVPGFTTTKIAQFNFRVDKNFEQYTQLIDQIAININGDVTKTFTRQSNDRVLIPEIKVAALTPSESENTLQYKEPKKWVFKNCELISVGSFTFRYSDASALTVNVKFTYGELSSPK